MNHQFHHYISIKHTKLLEQLQNLLLSYFFSHWWVIAMDIYDILSHILTTILKNTVIPCTNVFSLHLNMIPFHSRKRQWKINFKCPILYLGRIYLKILIFKLDPIFLYSLHLLCLVCLTLKVNIFLQVVFPSTRVSGNYFTAEL